MARSFSAFALLALMLVACSTSPDDSAVGGVTQGEADGLNEAAAMLDNQALNSSATLVSPSVHQ
jgi:hypothetical protein